MFVLPWLAAHDKSISVLAMQIMGSIITVVGLAFHRLLTQAPDCNQAWTARAFPDEDPANPVSCRQPDNPGRDQIMPFILLSDDELIAQLLIHTWTLTTGKILRSDVPPHELTEEELIDFWSDDRFDLIQNTGPALFETANAPSGRNGS